MVMRMYTNVNVYERVKKICKEKEITISGLERELNWGNGVIGRWGKTSPSIDKIFAVADELGVSLDELLGKPAEIKEETIRQLTVSEKILELAEEKKLKWTCCRKNDIEWEAILGSEELEQQDCKVFKASLGMGMIILYVSYCQENEEIYDLELKLYLAVGEGAIEEEQVTTQVLCKILKLVDKSLYEKWNHTKIESYRRELLGI